MVRVPHAVPELIAHNMVREALAPALQAPYHSDDDLDAIVARATMVGVLVRVCVREKESTKEEHYGGCA